MPVFFRMTDGLVEETDDVLQSISHVPSTANAVELERSLPAPPANRTNADLQEIGYLPGRHKALDTGSLNTFLHTAILFTCPSSLRAD